MLVCYLPVKSRRLANDVFKTFATHSALVHDISDTDCWAQSGTTHGHAFAIFNKQEHKLVEKLLCIFHFIPVSRACDALVSL